MSLLERLSLEHPVVQAGMGGGIATGRLAGAVSAAGALGTVGILPPAQLEAELSLAGELAGGRPVAANLLVPFARRAHVVACRRGGAKAVFLHGGPGRGLVAELKAAGAFVVQTAGTVPEAERALAEGADALVVQGVEAGGHLLGVRPALDALAPVLAIAGTKPVLVAGGIASHEEVRRALDAGAAGAVAGTRFLLSEECAAHPAYKRRVLEATRTIETRLFGLGWPMRHRVVPNAATDRWCGADRMGPRPVLAIQSLSSPLARLPMTLLGRTARAQRVSIPLFGPASPLEGMPEECVEAGALYAGETALQIETVLPAARAVALLAGVHGNGSPTISTP